MVYGFSPWLGSEDPICLMAKEITTIKQKEYCKNSTMGKKKKVHIFKKLLKKGCASSAEGAGLIPGQRMKILHAAWHSQGNKKNKMVLLFKN